MKCLVLVDKFPCETFVIRQVAALKADVVAGEVDRDILRSLNLSANVTSITNNRAFKGSLQAKTINKAKNLLGGWLPRWSTQAEQGWRKYLADNKPEVVLAQFGTNAIRSMEACKDYNVPLVTHFHGYDASELLRITSYRKKLSQLFEQSAACIVVSHVMKQAMIDLGCDAEKLHVIPCGVPITDFPLADQQQQQPCHFVAVGRFVDKKAPQLVVKAFEHCAQYVPEVKLTMIGDGPLLNQTISLAQASQYRDQINILGRQAIDVVSATMQSAGCFVQHSVTADSGDQEGWPVAVAEAASTGLPVIATRHAGIPEQVIDGKTGYLVDEFDWQSMGERMVRVAQDANWRKLSGLAGRAHIEKHGSFEGSAIKLNELIRSVVDKA